MFNAVRRLNLKAIHLCKFYESPRHHLVADRQTDRHTVRQTDRQTDRPWFIIPLAAADTEPISYISNLDYGAFDASIRDYQVFQRDTSSSP